MNVFNNHTRNKDFHAFLLNSEGGNLTRVSHRKFPFIGVDVFPCDYVYAKLEEDEKVDLARRIKAFYNSHAHLVKSLSPDACQQEFLQSRDRQFPCFCQAACHGRSIAYGVEFYRQAHRHTVFDKDIIFPLKTIEFEGRQFPCPNLPNRLLYYLYGDYRLCPPSFGCHLDFCGSQPIIPFEERIALLKAINGPDIVIPQKSLDHKDKIKKLHFDVFVVGDDWTGKYDYLEKTGITVVYFPYGEGVSSSVLKRRIADRYEKLINTADGHFPADAAFTKDEL